MLDKLGHVKAQLSLQSGILKPKYEHDSVKVCCPFHGGGREKTPSCSIRLTGNIGSFYCFACREKGSWNVLANAVNLAGFKKSDQVNDVFSFMMPEISYSNTRNPILEDYRSLQRYNVQSGWRTIDLDTLKLFDARFPKHEWYDYNRFVYFPVMVRKNYVGGIYARRKVTKEGKDSGELSYINTKGAFSKFNVFGFNVAHKRKGPLWWVEGPRDTMKITQLGGRAIGGLGSYVGPKKLGFIEALDPPCLIIATDPDEAGNKAREYIKDNLRGIPIIHAKFPDGKDPGNFTQRSFNKMIRMLDLEEYYEEAA